MAEGGASVTAASVWRVTSVHTARPAWAALIPASQNCQWLEITIMIVAVAAIVVVLVFSFFVVVICYQVTC